MKTVGTVYFRCNAVMAVGVPPTMGGATRAEDQRMVDLLVALGAAFVLAFVVAGPKARRVAAPPPAEASKPAKAKK